MPLIRINGDALEALRGASKARGRTLTGENEVGHDLFEVDISSATLGRLELMRLPGESLDDAIVRLSVAAQGKLRPN